MQITRCTVSSPGLFDNASIDLSDAVNVIYGKNGSGKSFLARALIDSIFRPAASPYILSKSSWDNLYVDIIIAIEPEEAYKITCNKTSSTSLLYCNSDAAISVPLEPDAEQYLTENSGRQDIAVIQKFYSSINQEIFIQSSFLPSPSDLGTEKHLDFNVIKDIILNDNSNFYSLFNSLTGKGRDETSESTLLSAILKHEGHVKDITKNIRIIDIQNSRTDKLNNEKKIVNNEIETMTNNINALESQKNIILDIAANIKKIEALHLKLNSIKQEVEEEQHKTETLSKMKQEITEQFPEFKGLEIDNSENLDRLQEIFNEARSVNEGIDKFYSGKKNIKSKLRKAALTINIMYGTFIGALAYTGSIKDQQMITCLAAGFGGVLVINAMLLVLPLFFKGTRKLESIMERKKSVVAEMETFAEKIQIGKDRFNISELYEFLLQYFEDYIEYSDKTREMMDLQHSLKERDYLQSIEKTLEDLKAEEERIQQTINKDLTSINADDKKKLTTENIDDMLYDIETKIDVLRTDISSKHNIITQIEEELKQSPEHHHDLHELLQEKKDREKTLKNLYMKKNVMDYITEILTSTVEKSQSVQLQKLTDRTLEIFNYLTENQYLSKVDDEKIKEFITTSAMPEGLNPTLNHFIILAVKLALTDFMHASGLSTPLILDDPFLFMDDEKIAKLRELILDISLKRQIIIFTHKKSNEEWGNYINL